MEIKLRRLSPSGELGYPLVRLRIDSSRYGVDVPVSADGIYLEPEFLVLCWSEVFVEPPPALECREDQGVRELRDSLIEDGTLFQRDACHYVFQRDYVFHSASLAASVILGRSVSGAEEWRDANGSKLADLLAEPVPA